MMLAAGMYMHPAFFLYLKMSLSRFNVGKQTGGKHDLLVGYVIGKSFRNSEKIRSLDKRFRKLIEIDFGI